MSKMGKENVWGQLKIILRSKYDESPFPAFEKNEKLKNKCEIVTYKGGENIKIDGVYIIISGIIAVGNIRSFGSTSDRRYFVQNLTLQPFSFLGEVEAPLETKKIIFLKQEPQYYAWVTSAVLSRVMAYKDKPIEVLVPSGINTGTVRSLVRLLDEKLLDFSDFKWHENGKKVVTDNDEKNFLGISNDVFVDSLSNNKILLPSEKEIFSRKVKAMLLKIPLDNDLTNELWNDKAIRRFVCEDSFIKSKRFWFVLQERKYYGETIIALYHHAEINNMLIGGELYLLGKLRVHAIINKSAVLRDVYNLKLKEYLKKKGFDILKSKDGSKRSNKEFINDSEILDFYEIMTLGQGGNKEIYKVKRISYT